MRGPSPPLAARLRRVVGQRERALLVLLACADEVPDAVRAIVAVTGGGSASDTGGSGLGPCASQIGHEQRHGGLQVGQAMATIAQIQIPSGIA